MKVSLDLDLSTPEARQVLRAVLGALDGHTAVVALPEQFSPGAADAPHEPAPGRAVRRAPADGAGVQAPAPSEQGSGSEPAERDEDPPAVLEERQSETDGDCTTEPGTGPVGAAVVGHRGRIPDAVTARRSSAAEAEDRTAAAGGSPAPEPDWDALLARVAAGERVRDVAASVGLHVRRLTGKVVALKRHGRWPPGAQAPAEPDVPEPEAPEPVLVEAEPEPEPEPEPDPESPVDPDGDWSAAEDVIILRRYGLGENSYRISQALKKRSAADVVNRFKALVPKSSAETQRAALDAAIARRDAEAGIAR